MLWIMMDMALVPILTLRHGRNHKPADENTLTCAGVTADVKSLSESYWLLTGLCLCSYAVLVAFSDFSADFFHEQYGYSPEKASEMQSVSTVISLIFTPIFGWISDRHGRRATMLLIAPIILVPSHLVISFIKLHPVVTCVLQGISSAVTGGALWPAISLVLPADLMTTAIGLMAALQNTVLLLAPQFVGWLRVHTGSYFSKYRLVGSMRCSL